MSDATREASTATRQPLQRLRDVQAPKGAPTMLLIGEPLGVGVPDALTRGS
ncbi:MAG: hypothetical protein R3F54_16410 [Alphaproteobacteria bacterium]